MEIQKLNILALETATPVCSVALQRSDGRILHRSETGMGIHSEKTFMFIQELMQETGLSRNDLDLVIVSGGPGSYTGLRIASSAVKGFLFGTSVKMMRVGTLAGIAAGINPDKNPAKIHTVLNARRTHLYHQVFEKSGKDSMRSLSEMEVRPIDEIAEMLISGDIIAGTGIQRIPEKALEGLTVLKDDEALSAVNLIRLCEMDPSGQFHSEVPPQDYEPEY